LAKGAKQSQGPKGELLEGQMNTEKSRKTKSKMRKGKACCRGHAKNR